MPKPFATWTVLSHGQLLQLDDNLLTVAGGMEMPLGKFSRRMTVARLRDGKLVIYSAIALNDDEMIALECFGQPAYLVVPNALHRMDARIWKDRYPTMQVIAPAGGRNEIEDVVPVNWCSLDFEDPRVQLMTVPGTAEQELAMVIRSRLGTTLVVNDLIWNMDDRPGLGGWLFKVMGFTGDEPRIPGIVEMREVKDKKALQVQLEVWSNLPNLTRIIVSHGKIITRDPAGTLHELATKLAA